MMQYTVQYAIHKIHPKLTQLYKEATLCQRYYKFRISKTHLLHCFLTQNASMLTSLPSVSNLPTQKSIRNNHCLAPNYH